MAMSTTRNNGAADYMAWYGNNLYTSTHVPDNMTYTISNGALSVSTSYEDNLKTLEAKVKALEEAKQETTARQAVLNQQDFNRMLYYYKAMQPISRGELVDAGKVQRIDQAPKPVQNLPGLFREGFSKPQPNRWKYKI